MDTMKGLHALDWARELSKLPDGHFTIAFFHYSRTRREASGKLKIMERCTHRAQLPDERFTIDSDNFFLFNDDNGDPKMCYRCLIRFMGFPNDNFKLHKISWI
jgi:hypothetical protein